MKKTQIKDTRRNIWKEKVSFLSIMIIALIAVASFLGINLGADGLFRNADKFYQRQNFRDFEINSTLLLDEEDMSGLRRIEGVSDVEGVYVDTGKVVKGDGFADINVVSLTDRINTVDRL